MPRTTGEVRESISNAGPIVAQAFRNNRPARGDARGSIAPPATVLPRVAELDGPGSRPALDDCRYD
jgi:hypothetical protein